MNDFLKFLDKKLKYFPMHVERRSYLVDIGDR